MINDRRMRMPPAVAHLKEKFLYRAEKLKRRLAAKAHFLWLRGVRRLERCLARARRRR